LTVSSFPRECGFLLWKRGGKWPSARRGCGNAMELRPHRTTRAIFFNCAASGLPVWL